MDLAVRRLLSLVVFFFYVSLLIPTTECGRTLQGHSSSGIPGDVWEPVTDDNDVQTEDLVPVKLFEHDPAGTFIDVTEFRVDNEVAESPMVGGVGENEEPNMNSEMDFAPRSIQASEISPVRIQPLSTPVRRKKAQSPISHSAQLGPLAVGMLVIAAIAVGLMLGAIGGLFFLRLMRDK
ncbi:hypothetical protein BSKO_00386 [Bryopsis sp. KO-2023]|nr:hypothetical protein BSKO_00386 [Bryopsis sp. KO-2023]